MMMKMMEMMVVMTILTTIMFQKVSHSKRFQTIWFWKGFKRPAASSLFAAARHRLSLVFQISWSGNWDYDDHDDDDESDDNDNI